MRRRSPRPTSSRDHVHRAESPSIATARVRDADGREVTAYEDGVLGDAAGRECAAAQLEHAASRGRGEHVGHDGRGARGSTPGRGGSGRGTRCRRRTRPARDGRRPRSSIRTCAAWATSRAPGRRPRDAPTPVTPGGARAARRMRRSGPTPGRSAARSVPAENTTNTSLASTGGMVAVTRFEERAGHRRHLALVHDDPVERLVARDVGGHVAPELGDPPPEEVGREDPRPGPGLRPCARAGHRPRTRAGRARGTTSGRRGGASLRQTASHARTTGRPARAARRAGTRRPRASSSPSAKRHRPMRLHAHSPKTRSSYERAGLDDGLLVEVHQPLERRECVAGSAGRERESRRGQLQGRDADRTRSVPRRPARRARRRRSPRPAGGG